VAQRATVLGCTPSNCATSPRVNTSGPVILRVTVRMVRAVPIRIATNL
jgi:hypothetical protein